MDSSAISTPRYAAAACTLDWSARSEPSIGENGSGFVLDHGRVCIGTPLRLLVRYDGRARLWELDPVLELTATGSVHITDRGCHPPATRRHDETRDQGPPSVVRAALATAALAARTAVVLGAPRIGATGPVTGALAVTLLLLASSEPRDRGGLRRSLDATN